MKIHMTVTPGKARLIAAALLLLLLALWELFVRQSALSALVLPAPSAVAAALWSGLASGYFWPHISSTLQALLMGLVAGSAFGLLAGMALAESELLALVLKPYVVVSQVVPKLALAPLFVLWFGFGMLPTVLITALICFFPLMENTLTGLKQVDAQRLQLFRMLGATRLQTLLRLRIRSALPYFFGGLRISSGLALIGAVVAEFVAGTGGQGAGLAYQILQAGFQLNIPRMFAALLLISLTGVALFVLMSWLTRVALGGWHASETSHD